MMVLIASGPAAAYESTCGASWRMPSSVSKLWSTGAPCRAAPITSRAWQRVQYSSMNGAPKLSYVSVEPGGQVDPVGMGAASSLLGHPARARERHSAARITAPPPRRPATLLVSYTHLTLPTSDLV